ncbi:MAG: hypothetical protein HYX69_12985 [Planctomycetia bacterium]|nr:hypothetical protein [Planctomycetia bacterium]
MSTKALAHGGLSFVVAAVCLTAGAAEEDQGTLVGQWKMVVPTMSESPLLIVKLSGTGEQPAGELVAAQEGLFLEPKVSKVEHRGDKLSIQFTSEAGDDLFVALWPKDGGADKAILGTFRLRDRLYPARLTRTHDATLERLVRPPLALDVMQALRERDAHAKFARLHQLVKEHAGDPNLRIAYFELLYNGDLSVEDARPLVTAWIDGAAPYGAGWLTETRTLALAALAKGKRLAPLRLEAAQSAAKALPPDATTEQRSVIARAEIESAEALGKTDVAAAARAQWQKLEAQLDGEYLESVPPFKVQPFAGRKDPRGNRVVVMELFTGAQCPPCVAADVGFDALLSTYKPTEFIGLQYHLHIPGPDALTNPDTIARSNFYEVQGTPSTFFNGSQIGGGGGGMGASKKKYDEFVGIVDEDLAAKRGGKIDLAVTRRGDTVQVNVAAEVNPDAVAVARADAKRKAEAAAARDEEGEAKKKVEDNENMEPKLRLRLVLVEETIHYPGGNKIRYHHHVVRGMPGGPEGKEIVDGACRWELPVNLTSIRDGLDKYLVEAGAEFAAKDRPFGEPLPPIELENLSVVALVQDDATKQILDAVVVPVPDDK